jgi:hypothetical protein
MAETTDVMWARQQDARWRSSQWVAVAETLEKRTDTVTVNGQRDIPAGGQRKSPPRVVLEKRPL